MPAQVNNSEKVSGPRNGPVQDAVQLLWYFVAALFPATQKNCQDKPRFRAAISNVKGIRWSWRVRSTLQRQTTNQYRDSLLDLQPLRLKKYIFLCGLTAPSPIFIFSGEGINLTAKWSPTNTTHFKAAGKPVWAFFFPLCSYFQPDTFLSHGVSNNFQ